jgi:hypothetical protein
MRRQFAERRRPPVRGAWRALILLLTFATPDEHVLTAREPSDLLATTAVHLTDDEFPVIYAGAPREALPPAYCPHPFEPLARWTALAKDCVGDAWHYVHVEYLSEVFWHSSTHPRSYGRGAPLVSSSWRNRPFHVGWFVGPLFADDVTSDSTSEDASLFGGYRLGWDFDHYWGTEWRIGWSRPEIYFEQQPQTQEIARLTLSDINLLYYPWGDSVIRPYGLLGVGLTAINFHDAQDVYRDETLFSVPFGVGVKHHHRRWLSWRLELLDNLAFGSGAASSMHNVSLTFGVEVHFGVRPRSYYPWNPSRHIW